MLRVSSLGLIRYHDTLHILSLRHVSKAVRQTAKADGVGHDIRIPHGPHTHSYTSLATPAASSETSTSHPHFPRDQQRAFVLEKPPDTAQVSQNAGVENSNASNTSFLSSGDVSLADVLAKVIKPVQQDVEPTAEPLPQAAAPTLKPVAQSPAHKGLQEIMATTSSTAEAWDAYERLLALPPEPNTVPIPYILLHRLARFLACTHPRTRTLFMRLLSVLSTLHATGGDVQLWEWNALIDCAGKGWRKTRLEDFQAALEVYNDMISHRPPGSAIIRDHDVSIPAPSETAQPQVQSDIYTYTTLLSIAGRTRDRSALQHAMRLFAESGLQPNRIAHLILIRFFTRRNDLIGVRSVLLRMKELNCDLNVDAVNACIWAYGRKGRLDVSTCIYRILRHRVIPEGDRRGANIRMTIDHLSETESLVIPESVKPDAITYYTLVQCYAYVGDLGRSLQAFKDLMTMSSEDTAEAEHDSQANDLPTMPAFRAIFLGFARHGRHHKRPPATNSPWTMDRLEQLFQSFISFPHDVRPSERTIYWILMAFEKLSGQPEVLRRVWESLVDSFGGGWGGRLERFRRKIYEDHGVL